MSLFFEEKMESVEKKNVLLFARLLINHASSVSLSWLRSDIWVQVGFTSLVKEDLNQELNSLRRQFEWCINNDSIIMSSPWQYNVKEKSPDSWQWSQQVFTLFFAKEEITCFLCLCQCGYCRCVSLATSSFLIPDTAARRYWRNCPAASSAAQCPGRTPLWFYPGRHWWGGERAVLAISDNSEEDRLCSQYITSDNWKVH